MYYDQISIKKRSLKMQKVNSRCKNYGQNSLILSKVFLNYLMILIELFVATTPSLHLILHQFYQDIIDLFTTYEWQRRVFFLALDLDISIV